MLPFPDFFDEVLPPNIMTREILLPHQLLLHHHLSGNASVVSARVPQNTTPPHTMPAEYMHGF